MTFYQGLAIWVIIGIAWFWRVVTPMAAKDFSELYAKYPILPGWFKILMSSIILIILIMLWPIVVYYRYRPRSS